jgi:hypothetical protein
MSQIHGRTTGPLIASPVKGLVGGGPAPSSERQPKITSAWIKAANSQPAEHRAAESEEAAEVARISLLAFLRSMWAIAWSAFRHPFTSTDIDLSTGKELPS